MCDVIDIYDSRNYNALDSRLREHVLVMGLKRDLSIIKGSKDKYARRFFYILSLELYQIEKNVIEVDLFILKNLIKY